MRVVMSCTSAQRGQLFPGFPSPPSTLPVSGIFPLIKTNWNQPFDFWWHHLCQRSLLTIPATFSGHVWMDWSRCCDTTVFSQERPDRPIYSKARGWEGVHRGARIFFFGTHSEYPRPAWPFCVILTAAIEKRIKLPPWSESVESCLHSCWITAEC